MWVPYSAMEHIRYKEIMIRTKLSTTYEKMLNYKTGAISNFIQKVNSSYKRGCMIVEEKCRFLKVMQERNKGESDLDVLEQYEDQQNLE